MKVLSVASEIYPLIKTGGLADVVGALPLALRSQGIQVRSLIPGYPAVMQRTPRCHKVVRTYATLMGGPASIVATQIDDLELFILHAPHLFDRPGGPYGDPSGTDWEDNWKRFAALSRVGSDISEGVLKGFVPDIVHAHDWQAAMTAAYMRYGKAVRTPSLVTIHNLAFQGQYPAAVFPQLGLPDAAMSLQGVEYYGGVGYLKAGLQSAWAITTVSPTYAREIHSPQFGMGLDGLLRMRSTDLHGILNGIDIATWDPQTDPRIPATYSTRSLNRRFGNRKQILQRFQLDEDVNPLFCVISRLTWQKGMDVLVGLIDDMVTLGVRIAVLGSGDHALEGAFLAASGKHPGRVGFIAGYDEELSHVMQAGCDAIVIPSRFEPCGLTQLYGLRYGCIPIVARTGGLADTVINANEAALNAGAATGFVFEPDNGQDLLYAVRRACNVYADSRLWSGMQRQGMKTDVSWTGSAARYARVYRSLMSRKPSDA
ncbi:glycogen synthase GlgA [Oleiagrimonas sp.]|jgi:starch synthase|uniref:glycogen synthase GlgA n=1 Tax=Oleiagrimonas sp. TaxID=2010330 RepID=UPI002609F377|nr:glycogen synthase GlgA [Oleiagrimonas sp.]MDA3913073.1 glycogen synthase GlgA [Oleiagrimonas sp.]